MSETQGPGGGALEPHYNGGGYGPPPSSGKDPYSPPSTTSTTNTNGNGHHDISGDPHQLNLLKSTPLNTFTSFTDPDVLGTRLSDGFMEMRYIELGSWDMGGYSEGLTARLIDSRSLADSPDNIIQYRPWEKPDPSLSSVTTTSSPTFSSAQQLILTSNGNVITSATPSRGNGVGKSPPPTLTTLTNAFPTFSDAFGPNGQKLPSFQSQFNSFNDPVLGSNGDMGSTGTSLPSFHTLPANRGGYPGGPPPHGHSGLLGATSIQARDLQNIQPQFLDERHIQLFPLGPTTMTAVPLAAAGHHGGMLANGNGHHFVTATTNGMNGTSQPHFVTAANAQPSQFIEFVNISQMQLHGPPPGGHLHSSSTSAHPSAKLQNQTTDGTIPGLNLNDLHHTHTHSNLNLNLNVPPSSVIGKYISADGTLLETLIAVKSPGPNGNGPTTCDPNLGQHHQQQAHMGHHHHQILKLEHQSQNSPQIVSNSIGGPLTPNQNGHKRQQKRKRNSIDAVDGFSPQQQQQQQQHQQQQLNNNHRPHNGNGNDLNNDPQVSSVSSSDSDFKRPNLGMNGSLDMNGSGGDPNGLDKPAKKKRKRCGECVGCSRKDNCGDCAPCRNDKSHQICKMRRCEKLTEKKNRAARVAVALMK